jgi:hypothetical protein
VKRTALRPIGKSETDTLKQEIQNLVRASVMTRDGGCIFRSYPHAPLCGAYRKDGQLILEADHLKGHHGWKKWHQKEYEEIVRQLIGPKRAFLWERCDGDSWRPKRTGAYGGAGLEEGAG